MNVKHHIFLARQLGQGESGYRGPCMFWTTSTKDEACCRYLHQNLAEHTGRE